MKSWPKVKLGQVQVGSNIAQNHSMSLVWPLNVIQGQMLLGKLKRHIWLTMRFVKNFDDTMHRLWDTFIKFT